MPNKTSNRSAAESVSAARLRELLIYDPETGQFRWRERPAGTVNNEGYVVINIDGKQYTGHRLAAFLMTGEWPEEEVDHENRRRADNRWSNLRPASSSLNKINSATSTRNTSGYRGVSWHVRLGKWEARIGVSGRRVHLGLFDCPQRAHEAYLQARETHYGILPGDKTPGAAASA